MQTTKTTKLDPLKLPPLDPLRRYPIDQASAYLAQSRAKTYKDIKAGLLPVIRDGARVYVPAAAIAQRSSLEAAE